VLSRKLAVSTIASEIPRKSHFTERLLTTDDSNNGEKTTKCIVLIENLPLRVKFNQIMVIMTLNAASQANSSSIISRRSNWVTSQTGVKSLSLYISLL